MLQDHLATGRGLRGFVTSAARKLGVNKSTTCRDLAHLLRAARDAA
jgi:hypothetical protein